MADQSRIRSFRTTPDGNGTHGTAPSTASPTEAAHGQARLNGHRGNGHGNGFDPHHASTGELVTQAAGQITTLVRSELALGKAELVDKGKKLGLGGGLIAAAGLFSLFTLGLLVTLFVVILDRDWPLWLAVLVPLLSIGVLTLLLASAGISRLRKGATPPTQAAGSVRDDIRSVRDAFRDGRAANHHEHAEGRH